MNSLTVMLVINMLLSVVNLILDILLFGRKKNKSNVMISSRENIEQISEDIIDDLVDYCKSEYDIDAYATSELGDQICLACKKEDALIKVVELKFPMSPKGTAEYNSTLEYQKEEIDEWRKKNA